jgi:competence protein ComK
MNSYEINASTLCVVPIDDERSYVYEFDNAFIVNMSCYKIIERSCLFFGCTLAGRKEGSSVLLNSMHKLPIIIEESNNIIFFPSTSQKNGKCIWISYNNYEGVDKFDSHYSVLHFKHNINLKVEISYFVLSNQIIRCKRLEFELNKRKKAV